MCESGAGQWLARVGMFGGVTNIVMCGCGCECSEYLGGAGYHVEGARRVIM